HLSTAMCSATTYLIRFFCVLTRPPRTSTLSLHDALPIYAVGGQHVRGRRGHPHIGQHDRLDHRAAGEGQARQPGAPRCARHPRRDRKSTRLNSSHVKTSYAVFCLKKKNPRRSHVPLPLPP